MNDLIRFTIVFLPLLTEADRKSDDVDDDGDDADDSKPGIARLEKALQRSSQVLEY